MGVSLSRKTFAFYLALFCGAALCAAPAREARAQEERPAPRLVAEKIDEYGNVRHCDLTARLDNLAIELQNDPEARGYLVGYDPSQRPGRYAEKFVKRSAAYLVTARGIDESRIVMRYGGRNDTDDVKTELWVVPQGASLPLNTNPVGEEDDGKELSGRLERYPTDDALISPDGGFVGLSDVDIGQQNFARALKKQTASQGYLVVYTEADELPGAWRRIARREGQSIRDGYELAEGRIRVINGGTADETSVELWIQPKDAPPPVKEARAEKSLAEAFRLYDLGNTDFVAGDDGERRLLADLADLLGMDKRARLNLIVHPPTPDADAAAEAASVQTAEAPPAAEPPQAALPEAAQEAAQATAGRDAADAGNGAAPEAAPQEETFEQKARRWREGMAKTYGIAPERVVVTAGRENSWDGETLAVWVVPADAPMPDAFAPEPQEETEPTEEDEEGAPPPVV